MCAYDLHDSKGFVAPGPSIGGLRDLEKAINIAKANPNVYPQVSSLLHNGYANNPSRFKYECLALSKLMKDKTVAQTLLKMGQAAAKSKHLVILHNHMS